MKNEIYREANHLSLPVPAGTKAGAPVRIGSLNGVCLTDRANTQNVNPFNTDGTPNTAYNAGGGNPHGNASVWLEGGYQLAVTAAAAPEVGAPVYIDAATNKLSDAGTTVFGHVISTPTDNGDGTFAAVVRLSN